MSDEVIPDPVPETLPDLATGVTKVLNKIIKDGRADCDGLPQSADISAAINWLKHNNISVGTNEADELDELRRRVKDAVGKRVESGLSPLDLDNDDEATR